MSSTSLLDAVRVVKENERIASESYARAVDATMNPLGKTLFTQLSDFENFHLQKLTVLEKSLEETGEFIDYTGKEFPLPPVFEIKAAQEPQQKSVMHILTEAIDLEKAAEKAYTELAGRISDPRGHQMFTRLAQEEHIHYRVLMQAYWSINDTSTWKWTRLEQA